MVNIKTGKKATPAAESYLLGFIEEGTEKRHQFIVECNIDGDRFEKPIKKEKIINFTSDNMSKENKSRKLAEVISAKRTRDLYGRLLFMVVSKRISVVKSFEYRILHNTSMFLPPRWDTVYQSDKLNSTTSSLGRLQFIFHS